MRKVIMLPEGRLNSLARNFQRAQPHQSRGRVQLGMIIDHDTNAISQKVRTLK